MPEQSIPDQPLKNCPTFVIGLARTAARHQQVIAAWRDFGVDVKLWEGVDGMQALEYHAGETLKWKERPSLSLPAVIACYLSHFRLWQHCLRQGYERVLILEDDAMPRPAVKALLPELFALPAAYELIRFFTLYPPPNLNSQSDIRRHTIKTLSVAPHILYRPYSQLLGTDSFLVHRRGLKKLTAMAMPITLPLDYYLYRFYLHKLRLYHVHPDIIRLSASPSTIQNVDASKYQPKTMATSSSVRAISGNEFEFHDFKLLLFNYVSLVRAFVYILRFAARGEFVRNGKVPPRLLRQVAFQPLKLIWRGATMLGRCVRRTITSW